jgi:hypothetical protein
MQVKEYAAIGARLGRDVAEALPTGGDDRGSAGHGGGGMKSITFNKPRVVDVNPFDQWVGDGVERHPEPKPAKPMKRFTIDVPASLHKRIKAQCATEGVKMADVLREILETRQNRKVHHKSGEHTGCQRMIGDQVGALFTKKVLEYCGSSSSHF